MRCTKVRMSLLEGLVHSSRGQLNPNGIYRYRVPEKPKSGRGNEVVADCAAVPMGKDDWI